MGSKIWNVCTTESNINGPVELGALEYETLRIEGCEPGFGFEMTGSLKNDDNKRNVKAPGPL